MADTENILPNDSLVNNLDNFNSHLGSANNGFNDFVNHLSGLVNSVRRIDTSLIQNTSGLVSGLSEISHNTRFNSRQSYQLSGTQDLSYNRPRLPDIGNLFDQAFQHPSFSNNIARNMSGAINSGIHSGFSGEVPSAVSRAKDTLNPVSFVQDAMMFGAVFPAQMKMAETIVSPVTQTLEAMEPVKSFSKGFTGMGSALEGFKSQLTDPFQMYEGIYESKAMLSSALGGEKESDNALKSALKMARDYPVKTEEALSALTKMAVYPEVKPNLSSKKFQTQLMETVSGLSLIAPEQGMGGAMFAMVEAMSGSQRSMQMRFNVSPEVIQSLSGMTKSEMSSDPTKLVEGLHRFIGKAVGLDVLEKQKYTFSKQIDNFGDSLQMVTKNVMENTGLYKTMTGAATAFQTGFSSLGENKEFINYLGSIFKPYQTRVDKAISTFMGVEIGAYKSMPMSQVMEAMEKNFSGLSMDEIGSKFETLIDDMGGIWKDTTLKIDGVISKKFGDVLGMIGGDIASVATSSFSNLASGVFTGIGQAIIENPITTVATAGSIAIPALATLGGASLIPRLIENGFRNGTFSNIKKGFSNRLQGATSSSESVSAMENVGAISSSKVTRSNLGNLINTQKQYLDNIISNNVNNASQRIDQFNKGISNRRASVNNRTLMDSLDITLDNSMDVSKMSQNNKKAFNDYFDKLKSTGMSSDDIDKLKNALKMESVEAIEKQNYINTGIRNVRGSDLSTLRREMAGVSYNYEMTRSTERALKYTGVKSPYGDSFRIGDEITSTMVSKLDTAAKDYSSLMSVRNTNDLSKITDTNALNRFAKDLNVSVADISKGNISNEQLRLLKQNGVQLRESSEHSRNLLDGFKNNRFQGVTSIERRASRLAPELNEAMSIAKTRNILSGLSNYEFESLHSSASADKMVRLMNKSKDSLSNVKLAVPEQMRSAIGGASEINLMESLNTAEFRAYRSGGMEALAKMSPAQQQRALRGSAALSILEQDSNVFREVTDAMGTGVKRLSALRYFNKLRRFVSNSTTLKNIGRVGGGLMSFIDPLLVGMQGYDIAKELGLSQGSATLAGIGASSAIGGGLFAAKRMMGATGFASSISKVTGIGGALTVLTTGMELYRQKLHSDREIKEQRESYMKNLDSINFEGIDKSLLMKAGGAVMGNEKLRQQQGYKSMMNNALLKSLLIGGGAAATILSGGTLLPLLGLVAAGAGVTQTGSDYFSGKSKMTTESKGLQGLSQSFVGGAEFYNKKIEDFNNDIADLEYKKEAGGGLTSAEQTKLITTRKLRNDATQNRNIQLKAINTVADIYGTENTGQSETYDDEKASSSFRLINYLSKENSRKGTVSEYLGAASVSSQVSQNLNEVMQEGIEKKDFLKVSHAVRNAAKINNAMTDNFQKTLKNVDFGDTNQVQTVLQAEMGRLGSLIAPLGDKKGMELYKELNQGSLIQSKMFAQVRGSLGTSKNERNLYSTIEMEAGRKLAEIGVEDPYEAIGKTKEEYFKEQGLELPIEGLEGLSKSTDSKLKNMGITDTAQLSQRMSTPGFLGLPTYGTGLELAKKSGNFSKEELQELEKAKNKSSEFKKAEEDYNNIQINSFKGFANAISDNEKSFNKVSKQQSIYEDVDISKLSKGKQQELQYAMERRASSVSDIKGNELISIAQQKFGKDVSLKDLSDTQITELMQDKDVQKSNVFGKMKSASQEFEKSSLALGKVFEATSQTVEKQFNYSLQMAGNSIKMFSAKITSSGDFSNKTMEFVNTLNDSIETLSLTGESKKIGAEKDFESMKDDKMTNLAFDLAGITSAKDLSTKDSEGLTGLDRLRQMGTLTDEKFGQVSQLSSGYTEGEKDILKSRTMGLEAAKQMGSLAFQASSVGGDDFKRVASTMLGINYEQRTRLRESSAKELRTAFEGYQAAGTPEEKERQSQFIDKNIAAQRQLGLNDYQIRAGIQQFGGGDASIYDKVTKQRVDDLISKTNSRPMLSLLTGSEENAKQLQTDMQGYGVVTAKGKEPAIFNEQHSKLAGEAIADSVNASIGTQQLSNAVNNFKQASVNQVDTVSKQSEITSAAITTAEIDSNVNKTITQQSSIENQQIVSGDVTTDGVAAANNAAALEGLVNRTPSISPPANEETFIVMP